VRCPRAPVAPSFGRHGPRDFALAFFQKLRADGGKGLLPLCLHVLMGETFREKVANMIANLEQGVIAPVEIFARKKAYAARAFLAPQRSITSG